MPLIDVTCSERVPAPVKQSLADALGHIVSVAVACQVEPYDGHLKPGDVIVRFRDAGPFDRIGLDVVIEVQSKLFDDRVADRDHRVARIVDDVRATIGDWSVGVALNLPVAAWAQSS